MHPKFRLFNGCIQQAYSSPGWWGRIQLLSHLIGRTNCHRAVPGAYGKRGNVKYAERYWDTSKSWRWCRWGIKKVGCQWYIQDGCWFWEVSRELLYSIRFGSCCQQRFTSTWIAFTNFPRIWTARLRKHVCRAYRHVGHSKGCANHLWIVCPQAVVIWGCLSISVLSTLAGHSSKCNTSN